MVPLYSRLPRQGSRLQCYIYSETGHALYFPSVVFVLPKLHSFSLDKSCVAKLSATEARRFLFLSLGTISIDSVWSQA